MIKAELKKRKQYCNQKRIAGSEISEYPWTERYQRGCFVPQSGCRAPTYRGSTVHLKCLPHINDSKNKNTTIISFDSQI